MRHGAGRIDEERVCIDSLVRHLTELDISSRIEAQQEPDDPPDYWLTVGERRFAVEITSIVDDQGYAALCSALHDAIKTQIASDSSITGKYAVCFSRRPGVPRRGTREWTNLVADAVSKIRGLARLALDSKSIVHRDVGGQISVSRWSPAGSAVAMCRTFKAEWEVEAQGRLSQLMTEAIDKKLRKLQKKGVMTACPDVILLLYDTYGYGSLETAKRAASSIKGHDWLHSIFWAASFSDRNNVMYPDSPGRDGAFLCSKNEGWRQLT